MIEDAKKGGLAGGYAGSQHPNSKRALAEMLQDTTHQKYASHCSNHVRRGIVKLGCEFCMNPPSAEG
jgi:hypothetical protein